MEQSILRSVKKVIGVSALDTSFDEDILMHINTALATLNQVGIGPEGGFFVSDDTALWSWFIGSDARYSSAKSYVYAKVKLLFDPPTTSFHLEALKETIREMEYRLNTLVETSQFETNVTELDFDLDGGDPYFTGTSQVATDGGAP